MPSDAGDLVSNPDIFTLQTILPRTTATKDTETQEMSYHYDHSLLPDNRTLQKNVKCGGNTKEHVVAWSFDDCIEPESEEADHLEAQGRGRATGSGDIVRSLGVGDVVTVWAKARFPGWMNVVEEVKMDVYWAV